MVKAGSGDSGLAGWPPAYGPIVKQAMARA